VLMRCGPAFDLHGQLSLDTTPQNRVVIDALTTKPEVWRGCSRLLSHNSDQQGSQDLPESASKAFSACSDKTGHIVALRIVQNFPAPAMDSEPIITEMVTSRST